MVLIHLFNKLLMIKIFFWTSKYVKWEWKYFINVLKLRTFWDLKTFKINAMR